MIHIELRACDRAANLYRQWRLDLAPDLFGIWHLVVTFGRIGCEGRARVRLFNTEAEARRFVCRAIRRRRTAPRRIGASYDVVALSPAAATLLADAGFSGVPQAIGHGPR